MFSSITLGNSPFKLLWGRSTTIRSYYWDRNLGIMPVCLFRLQYANERIFNWNWGTQLVLSVSTSNMSLSLDRTITSRLEWLENALNDNRPSKRLEPRSRYSRDVRLLINDEGIFPVNWFKERSNSLRDLMLLRQGGNIPSKEFPLRSNSWRFFSLQNPGKPAHYNIVNLLPH